MDEHSPQRRQYPLLIKEDKLTRLLRRYEAVLLNETQGACGSRHATYFLSNIQAGLSYTTLDTSSDGGPLGTPRRIQKTEVCIYSLNHTGIETFLTEFDREICSRL